MITKDGGVHYNCDQLRTCVDCRHLPRIFLLISCIINPYAGWSEVELIYLDGLSGAGTAAKAMDVSSDGTTIAGESWNGTYNEAFMWTASSGMIGLGRLNSTGSSSAYGVSGDGLVIVGESDGKAFRWTSSTGMSWLGATSDISTIQAKRSSYDGSSIVGYGNGSSGQEAFVWNESTGVIALETQGTAYDVSGDGTMVVGERFGEAWWWTDDESVVNLPDLPVGTVHTSARGISDDGSTIVGVIAGNFPDYRQEAFLRTASDGIDRLGDILETDGAGVLSQANDVSGDGSVIVGYGTGSFSPYEAAIWRKSNGYQPTSITTFIDSLGYIDRDGSVIQQASAVSDDGSTIVGTLADGRAFVLTGLNVYDYDSLESLLIIHGLVKDDLGLDPDHDGLSTHFELALGTDPFVWDPEPLIIDPDNISYPSLEQPSSFGVSIKIQECNDLTGWGPYSGTSAWSAGAVTGEVTFGRFYRLHFEQVENFAPIIANDPVSVPNHDTTAHELLGTDADLDPITYTVTGTTDNLEATVIADLLIITSGASGNGEVTLDLFDGKATRSFTIPVEILASSTAVADEFTVNSTTDMSANTIEGIDDTGYTKLRKKLKPKRTKNLSFKK